MAFPTVYHEGSDADDEFERGMMSPAIAPSESDRSPTDSDPHSTEHTPRLYGHFGDDRSPHALILDWSADETAEYISTLGLPQYFDAILDNEIVGEALVALRHEELKEMGMMSMGHRLTVLKSVYDIKIRQGVPIEPEHYIPPSVAASKEDSLATQDDVARIVQSIKLRDERIIDTERELRKITEEYRKLREELLPVFRMAKNSSQPLPFHPNNDLSYDQVGITSQPQLSERRGVQDLSYASSSKKPFLGSPLSSSGSPTHLSPFKQDNKSPRSGDLDPSAAAIAASNHLTSSSMNGGSTSTSTSPGVKAPNIPSPTSPPSHSNYQSTLANRSYRGDAPTPNNRTGYQDDTTSIQHASYASNASTLLDRDRATPTPATGRRADPNQPDPPGSAGSGNLERSGAAGTASRSGDSGSAPSVEIFKSFRVSMEDPCYKVLPAALKKYNINADWRQYALYIVYGDQERCLGLQEKPLILFKQLDTQGRKPMFMLRRHAAPAEGHSGTYNPDANMTGLAPTSARSQASHQSGIQLPGGVL